MSVAGEKTAVPSRESSEFDRPDTDRDVEKGSMPEEQVELESSTQV